LPGEGCAPPAASQRQTRKSPSLRGLLFDVLFIFDPLRFKFSFSKSVCLFLLCLLLRHAAAFTLGAFGAKLSSYFLVSLLLSAFFFAPCVIESIAVIAIVSIMP
jgi:hypothetical protein